MAMETCLQVSRVCNTRIGAIQSHRTFSSKEHKLIELPTFKGLKKSTVTLSSSSSSTSFPLSNSHRSRKSLFVCKAREAVNEVQVVTDSSWKNLVLGIENPVLVEFWAPWCGPCRMIAPVVDELAKEYGGKISCYKLNTDDCPTIASQYGIRSIPTVLFFKNGEKKESVIGAVPKSTLSATVEKYLESIFNSLVSPIYLHRATGNSAIFSLLHKQLYSKKPECHACGQQKPSHFKGKVSNQIEDY